MELNESIDSLSGLAGALKDNPAAESFIGLLFWAMIAIFVYYFVSMIISRFKESRVERTLTAIEQALKENTNALGQVTTALSNLEK